MQTIPAEPESPPRRRDRVEQFFRGLGPGLITGAAAFSLLVL